MTTIDVNPDITRSFWLLSKRRATHVYHYAMIAAFGVPMLIYAAVTLAGSFGGQFSPLLQLSLLSIFVPIIGALAGTHVFATTYLITDSEVTVGIDYPVLKLIVIPIGFIILNIVAVTKFSLPILLIFMVFYAHYAMFHFSRQNIGVLTFSLLSSGRGPTTPHEKQLINLVTLAGMLSATSLFAPAYMLDTKRYPFDTSWLMPLGEWLLLAGGLLYVVILFLATRHYWLNRDRLSGATAALYWIAICFYLPVFVLPTDYSLLRFALFTTVHGLQYLVFLGLHAYYRSATNERVASLSSPRESVSVTQTSSWFDSDDFVVGAASKARTLAAIALPIALFGFSVWLGHWIWSNSATLFEPTRGVIELLEANEGVWKFGMGLVLGITLSHYWVDQHLWKFRKPERRKWLAKRYPFLVPG